MTGVDSGRVEGTPEEWIVSSNLFGFSTLDHKERAITKLVKVSN